MATSDTRRYFLLLAITSFLTSLYFYFYVRDLRSGGNSKEINGVLDELIKLSLKKCTSPSFSSSSLCQEIFQQYLFSGKLQKLNEAKNLQNIFMKDFSRLFDGVVVGQEGERQGLLEKLKGLNESDALDEEDSNWEEQRIGDVATKGCLKQIVYFGLRPIWKSNPAFKSYVKFPRIVNCPEIKCNARVTHETRIKDTKKADGVVFTNIFPWINFQMWSWLVRSKGKQRWIMVTQESPLYTPGLLPPHVYSRKVYDYADTYKRDSDFYTPYGAYKAYSRPYHNLIPSPEESTREKTRVLVWVSSHCETLQWDRTRFVTELQQFIAVDRYGKCGEKICQWGDKSCTEEDIYRNYMFTLALENSCCEDYITEKFWRALELGVVPVVVGAPLQTYKQLAPPNSFIHADEFMSMAHMADFLYKVADNKTQYNEYFKWRALGVVTNNGPKHFIHPLEDSTICRFLGKIRERRDESSNFNPYGGEWVGSCGDCGQQTWMKHFHYPSDHKRKSGNIWD